MANTPTRRPDCVTVVRTGSSSPFGVVAQKLEKFYAKKIVKKIDKSLNLV